MKKILFLVFFMLFKVGVGQNFSMTMSPNIGCPNTTHDLTLNIKNEYGTALSPTTGQTIELNFSVNTTPIYDYQYIINPGETWDNGETKSITLNTIAWGNNSTYTISLSVYVKQGGTTLFGPINNTTSYLVSKPIVNAGIDIYACPGMSYKFDAKTYEPNSTFNYNWTPTVSNGSASTFSSSGSSTYSVIATRTSGGVNCASDADEVVINVNSNYTALSAQVNAGTDQTICLNEQVTLTATTDKSNISFLWSPTITNGSAFTPSSAGTTTYTVTATNDSTKCAIADDVVVTVNNLPNTPTLSLGNDQQTITATNEASTYTWYLDDVKIDNANSNTYFATQTGKYTVKATDNNSCNSALSTGLTIDVLSINEGNDIEFNNVKLFPNPTTDYIHIDALNHESYQISIIDMQGHEVYNSNIEGNTSINVSQYDNGVYTLKLMNQRGNFDIRKVVIK